MHPHWIVEVDICLRLEGYFYDELLFKPRIEK